MPVSMSRVDGSWYSETLYQGVVTPCGGRAPTSKILNDLMTDDQMTAFLPCAPPPYFFVMVGGSQPSIAFKSGRYMRMKRWNPVSPVGNQ